MATIPSVRSRTKAPGDHGSAIALGFIVLVLICLAAVSVLVGFSQDPETLIGP